MGEKNNHDLNQILVCPDDYSSLSRDELGFRCSKCSNLYPMINGIISFLPSEIENPNYDIPWHPIPKQNLINKFLSGIRRAPIYWRLLITSDHFSLVLERTIFKLIKKSKAAIDIGCREGTNLMYASDDGICIGIDIDLKSVQYANSMTPTNCHALLASGTKMPFKEGSFDCIICTDVIEHVEKYDQLVREISRIGRPQGCRLVLSTPSGDVVPAPYELHYKHFREKELEELLKPHFRDFQIRSIPRNCRVQKLKWWFVNRFGKKFRILYMMINMITNVLYYSGRYHKDKNVLRKDVSDATFIVIASR